MTQLNDRRSVAAITSRSPYADDIGKALTQLLEDEPELELASVRLIQREDGLVGIAGRIGQLAGVECPQCHQPAGRPHTEYCTLAPGKVWDGVLPEPPKLVCRRCNGYGLVPDWDDDLDEPRHKPCPDCAVPACAYPSSNHGDGCGCQHDDCPRHGQPFEDEPGDIERCLAAADSGDAGHWPTVAAYLAGEVRRLRGYR